MDFRLMACLRLNPTQSFYEKARRNFETTKVLGFSGWLVPTDIPPGGLTVFFHCKPDVFG